MARKKDSAYSPDKKELYERSLYYFSKEALGYSRLTEKNHEWALDLQEIMGSQAQGLYMKPRGSFKSTLYVEALVLWLSIKYPDKTILIVMGSKETAARKFRAIRKHLEGNRRLLECWGVLHDKDHISMNGIWNKNRDPDDANYATPNIRPVGKNQNVTGEHYDMIICDDIVTDKDRAFRSEREATKQTFKELFPILNPGGDLIIVGTEWHFEDLYHWITDELNKELKAENKKPFKVERETVYDERPRLPGEPVEYDYDKLRFAIDGEGNPWLDANYLKEQEIKLGPAFFAAQYLNNAVPSEAVGFPLDRITLFDPREIGNAVRPDFLHRVTYWDPAYSTQDQKRMCYSSVVTIGYDKKTTNVYVLGATLKKTHTTEMVKDVGRHLMAYRPHVLSYETSGDPALMKRLLTHLLIEDGMMTTTKLKPTPHYGTTKDDRIESLVVLYDQGLLKFREDWHDCTFQPSYNLLVEQLTRYPLHSYKDGPDALAGSVEHLSIDKDLGYGAVESRLLRRTNMNDAAQLQAAFNARSASRQRKAVERYHKKNRGGFSSLLDNRLSKSIRKGRKR